MKHSVLMSVFVDLMIILLDTGLLFGPLYIYSIDTCLSCQMPISCARLLL